MSLNFSHFIISRFNINFEGLYKTKYGAAVGIDNWLQHRFNLFEQYCFPSIRAQTNQNFEWLVFFDTDTPQKYISRIAELQLQFKNFKPVYIASAEVFKTTIRQYVTENAAQEYVITSRVDNDDMLRSDFTELIQQSFAKERYLVDVPNGLQLSLEHNAAKLTNTYSRYGPFISLVEPLSMFRSVYDTDHKKWQGLVKYKALDQRLWVQIIHDKNVLNRFYGRSDFLKNYRELRSFGVTEEHILELENLPVANKYHNFTVPLYKMAGSLKLLLKGALNKK